MESYIKHLIRSKQLVWIVGSHRRCRYSSASATQLFASNQQDNAYLQSEEGKRWLSEIYRHVNSEPMVANDMTQLVQQRYGSFIDSDPNEETKATKFRILSFLLTYPLTLSYALNKIYSRSPWLLDKELLNVLVLGSRAEAWLPMRWWMEALHIIDKNSKVKEICLQHLGPHIDQSRLPRTTASPSVAGRIVQTSHLQDPKQFLHDRHDKYKLLLGCDMIIGFNPGFSVSNDASTNEWEPTIDLLIQTKRPVVATAFSEADLRDDLAYLDKLSMREDDSGLQLGDGSIEMILDPGRNPFRSHRIDLDLTAKTNHQAVIRNDYVYIFQGK